MTFRPFVLVVVWSSLSFAQRVSFPAFTGKNAAAVRTQVMNAACDTLDCVSPSTVTTKNKPDWKKAKKAGVQSFVTGVVGKKGLELSVFNKAGKPRAKKTFPLDRTGTLSAKNLQGAMDLLGVTMDSAPAPAPAPAKKEETPDVAPAPAPTKSVAAAPEEKTEEPAPAPRATTKKAAAEPAPKKADGAKPRFLVLDVGADVLNRTLTWDQLATGNLRGYSSSPVFVAVRVGAEFYPLALTGRDDLLSGLGVEANVSFAPWLQSSLSTAPAPFPTSFLRFDGGIRWNIVPVKAFPFAITPYVGVRHQSFTTSALSDGRRLDGLPNMSYLGLRAGLGLDVPIVKDVFSIFGRFSVIPTFSSGEVISPTYFASGSSFGLEGNAGVAVRILIMEIRASFEIANQGLTFTTQPTDTYVAAGANDRYLGGNLTLRFGF